MSNKDLLRGCRRPAGMYGDVPVFHVWSCPGILLAMRLYLLCGQTERLAPVPQVFLRQYVLICCLWTIF